MPFKTGLTFTYDSGEFEKNMDMALELADAKGFKARKAKSRKRGQAARLRPVQHHRARRSRRHRRRRSALRPFRRGDDLFRLQQPGPGPRDRVQATGLRPARPRPRRRAIRAGRHRPGVLRRRHRRLALVHHGAARPFSWRRKRSIEKAQGDCRASAQGRRRRTEFCRRRVFQQGDQPHATRSKKSPKNPSTPSSFPRTWRRACPPTPSMSHRSPIIRTAATSANWKSSMKPEKSTSCATRW